MIRLTAVWQALEGRRRRQALGIGVLLSTVLLGVLLSLTDPRAIATALVTARVPWVAAAGVVLVALHVLVALRLMLVLGRRGAAELHAATDVTLSHAVLLSVLPARLGDVCYPLLLVRGLAVDLAGAVANLLVIRAWDFLTAGTLLLATLVVLRMEAGGQAAMLQATLVALTVGLGAIGAGLLVMRGGAARWSGARTPVRRVLEGLTRVHAAVLAYGPRAHVVLAVVTVARWLLAAVLLYCLMRSLALEIGFAGALFVSMGLNLAVAIPVQTLGGFGLVESAMAVLLGLLGVPVEQAVAVAVALRVLWLALLAGSAALWFAARGMLRPRRAPIRRTGESTGPPSADDG